MRKKSSLDSGLPCIRHNCVSCCIKTKMPLSQSDINRISNLGYNIHSFSLKNGRDRQLKNYSDECVFLGKKGCKIYPYRPEGCLLYPLIYDEESEDFVLDSLCPYTTEFIVRKVDKQKLTGLFKKLQSDII